jgi:hypothetical protein
VTPRFTLGTVILLEDFRFRIYDFNPNRLTFQNHKSEIINPKLFFVERRRKLFDLFGALEIFKFDAAIKRALVALGFAAAQMGLANMRSHQFATRRNFEPLGGCFVGFNLWHAIYSNFNFQAFTINSRG